MRVKMSFFGRLDPRSFQAYLTSRATRLALDINIKVSESKAVVYVENVEALIGALEMAACIAPEDCLVSEWKVVDISEQ